MKTYYALISSTHIARHPDALGVVISRHRSFGAAVKAHGAFHTLAKVVTVREWPKIGENIYRHEIYDPHNRVRDA